MDRPRKWMALERAAHAPPPEGRARPRGVGRRGGRLEASGAIPGGAAPGADLGGSSDRSDENSEGRSGEGFRANGVRTRVSRPRGKGRFRKGRRRDRPGGAPRGVSSGRRGRAPRRKGTGSTSPDRDAEGSSGDANEPGDVDGGPGEGSLPSSTARRPALEIGSAGDRAGRPAERPGLRDVRSAPAGP